MYRSKTGAAGVPRNRWWRYAPLVLAAALAACGDELLNPEDPARHVTGASQPTPGDACAGITLGGTNRDWTPVSAQLLARCLRLNQIQVLGTHNSYKGAITPQLLAVIGADNPPLASELDYWHPPLAHQFSHQGIRKIELDIFADPDGGRYAGRMGLTLVGLPNPTPPELLQPGFKVLHIQDVDFNSTCLTLVSCLTDVRDWSDANPGHLPIAVLMEMKTDAIGEPFVVPLPIRKAELLAVDAEILSVFDRQRIITPDDVRGDHETLDAAVRAGNWPTLRDAAGKVLFLMDNAGSFRTDYRDGAPALEGRVMFTNATPGDADAAFIKRNDPRGANTAAIAHLVAQGYVVRTRADTPTDQARTNDRTMQDAAFASGAQWVSTDYPVPGSSPFSAYFAAIPGGELARCNPVNTGPRCVDRLLERWTGSSRSR